MNSFNQFPQVDGVKSTPVLQDSFNDQNIGVIAPPAEEAHGSGVSEADRPQVLEPVSGGLCEGVVAQNVQAPSRLESVGNVVRRNKIMVAAGAVSIAGVLASPLGDTLKILRETVPGVGLGLLAAEVVWIGGAAVALTAPSKSGNTTWNPLKIKQRFAGLSDIDGSSRRFRVGFAINALAAAAQFAIPAGAIVMNFPITAWGLVAWPALELGAAITLRRGILNKVRRPE